jgi:hypothetical protein
MSPSVRHTKYIWLRYLKFKSDVVLNIFVRKVNYFMTNLNKNEINISRFASKTMWPFVTTTLISNVVNTTRWHILALCFILFTCSKRLKIIWFSSHFCERTWWSFFQKRVVIFTHLFLNGWFYNLPSIQFYGIINNLLFLRKYLAQHRSWSLLALKDLKLFGFPVISVNVPDEVSFKNASCSLH